MWKRNYMSKQSIIYINKRNRKIQVFKKEHKTNDMFLACGEISNVNN